MSNRDDVGINNQDGLMFYLSNKVRLPKKSQAIVLFTEMPTSGQRYTEVNLKSLNKNHSALSALHGVPDRPFKSLHLS